MRLWTLHPGYLDTQGLLALWREALLAQAVLRGKTQGYRRHPQLCRFRREKNPTEAIGAYLDAVHAEGSRRGYRFDARKIHTPGVAIRMPATRGQLSFEREHLLKKLFRRDPVGFLIFRGVSEPVPHPVFRLTDGDIEPWERGGES